MTKSFARCSVLWRISSCAVVLVLAWRPASAHERDFTLSRDWHLPYMGENEIESRTFWQDRHNDWTQQFEYEYGVTDHFAIEPGLTFHKANGDEVKIDAAEAELRFNVRDFGFNTLLPALNVEYERHIKTGDDDADEEEEADNEAEIKGILSWYTERGEDFTLNLNVGKSWGGEGEHEWESELTLGYLRPLDFIPGLEPSTQHRLNCGVEFIQHFRHEHFAGAGPVFTFRASQHLHVLLAAIIALNKRDEQSDEFRLILEWEF